MLGMQHHQHESIGKSKRRLRPGNDVVEISCWVEERLEVISQFLMELCLKNVDMQQEYLRSAFLCVV